MLVASDRPRRRSQTRFFMVEKIRGWPEPRRIHHNASICVPPKSSVAKSVSATPCAVRAAARWRRAVVERTIARAYRELLRREPDPTGLAGYRRAIIERRWTENQVRADIMRSAEYRALTQGGGRDDDRVLVAR